MANRPLTLEDYVGQGRIKTQLRVIISAAQKNQNALPHFLLYGNPGLGKTTLAEIIANEFRTDLHVAMGGNLNSTEDVRQLLLHLHEDGGDIIFIDEIHRMPVKIEEMFYTAMEDCTVDIDCGEGMKKYELPPFTLIGATTLPADLSRPLRDRFGVHFQLQNYQIDEVGTIIEKLAKREEVTITDGAIAEIAKRAKGVARIAINYFKRCKEWADVFTEGLINEQAVTDQFSIMGIDEIGLDENDHILLNFLANQTRPVGISALATGCDIDSNTIQMIIEPYLVQKGLINRTNRGREIALRGLEWIGLAPIVEPQRQSNNRSTNMERLR